MTKPVGHTLSEWVKRAYALAGTAYANALRHCHTYMHTVMTRSATMRTSAYHNSDWAFNRNPLVCTMHAYGDVHCMRVWQRVNCPQCQMFCDVPVANVIIIVHHRSPTHLVSSTFCCNKNGAVGFSSYFSPSLIPFHSKQKKKYMLPYYWRGILAYRLSQYIALNFFLLLETILGKNKYFLFFSVTSRILRFNTDPLPQFPSIDWKASTTPFPVLSIPFLPHYPALAWCTDASV